MLVIWGCIILSTICLTQEYRKFQEKIKASNSEAVNQLYYQLVIPKAIFIGIGLVAIYLLSVGVINHMLFSEVQGKPFYLSMLNVMVGAISMGAAMAMLATSLRKK